jgi:hypothetical protein
MINEAAGLPRPRDVNYTLIAVAKRPNPQPLRMGCLALVEDLIRDGKLCVELVAQGAFLGVSKTQLQCCVLEVPRL